MTHAEGTALVARATDPALADRLTDAAARGLVVTVVGGAGDPRVGRLVRAAGAVAVDREPATGDRVTEWDGATLDRLMDEGVRLGADPPPPPPPADLSGIRAVHVTSVHRPDDGRIYRREVAALRAAGADATVMGFDPRPSRGARVTAGWRLMARARRAEPDIVHIHDPELLVPAAALAATTRVKVVYDAHEYLSQTTRTKPWIPRPVRTPLASVVGIGERTLARTLDAVVGVTEDMALEFARAGIDAVSVANFASVSRFTDLPPAEPRTIVYVGALDRSRGLEVMRQALPLVTTTTTRLLLAGPGDPGDMPEGVEFLGRLDYDAVPGVLARGSVVWMPLQHTPNNDRGRLTKVMEAMACGRPLVASDLRRTATIIRQADAGLIVPAADPAAHARALSDLLDAPERAAALGANGRRAFLDHMTFEHEAAKLVDLYARLVGRRAS